MGTRVVYFGVWYTRCTADRGHRQQDRPYRMGAAGERGDLQGRTDHLNKGKPNARLQMSTSISACRVLKKCAVCALSAAIDANRDN